MTRLRLLFLCLLMLTVPFQGFAATAMIMCGITPSHHTEARDSSAHHSDAGHEERSVVKNQLPSDQKSLPDTVHKCGVCAACCSAAVINSYAHVPAAITPASALVVETLVSIYAVHPQQPEKPPRA